MTVGRTGGLEGSNNVRIRGNYPKPRPLDTMDFADDAIEIYRDVITPQIQEDYNLILAHYTKKGPFLVAKTKESNAHAVRELSQHLLMNLVISANNALKNLGNGNAGASFQLNIPDWDLLAKRDNHNFLHIVKWDRNAVQGDLEKHPRFIGKGTYGIVLKVDNISLARIDALKLIPPWGGERKVPLDELKGFIVTGLLTNHWASPNDLSKK